MNRFIAGIIGGAAGAVAVTAVHEYLRRVYAGAPRLDELGKEATAKVAEMAGAEAMDEKELYYTSMGADLISNMTYYSCAAANEKHPVLAGAVLGLMAGAGAVTLPGKMGLDESATNRDASRRWITIGLYTLGGCIAGVVIERLTRRRN